MSEHSIKILVTKPSITYFINLSDDNITLTKKPEFKVEATIAGPATSFLILAITQEYTAAIKAGLAVEGNLEIAAKLQKKIFGKKFPWFSDFKQSLCYNISDYLLYEKQLLANQRDLEDYLHEVDLLRLAVDRIEAKINKYYA